MANFAHQQKTQSLGVAKQKEAESRLSVSSRTDNSRPDHVLAVGATVDGHFLAATVPQSVGVVETPCRLVASTVEDEVPHRPPEDSFDLVADGVPEGVCADPGSTDPCP